MKKYITLLLLLFLLIACGSEEVKEETSSFTGIPFSNHFVKYSDTSALTSHQITIGDMNMQVKYSSDWSIDTDKNELTTSMKHKIIFIYDENLQGFKDAFDNPMSAEALKTKIVEGTTITIKNKFKHLIPNNNKSSVALVFEKSFINNYGYEVFILVKDQKGIDRLVRIDATAVDKESIAVDELERVIMSLTF